MNYTRKRTREEMASGHSNPPSFIKIIFIPKDDKLSLPTAFMRKHGRNLSNKVYLKAPGGRVREIGLVRFDGHTWLDKGWKEFSEFYSIGYAQILVFKYDGNSYFDVLITKVDGMEIHYPKDDDEVEEMDHSLKSSKKPRVDNVKGNVNGLEIDHSLKSSKKPRVDNVKGNCDKGRGSRKVVKEKSEAYQKAVDFFSDNHMTQNSAFISIMYPSYVCRSPVLNVPYDFANANLPNEGNFLSLCDSSGKTWPIRYRIFNEIRSAKISSGWNKFVQDNELKHNDVCIFKVLESVKLTWEVFIFRC